jgi:beta-glucanase (GH16 family)
MIIMRTTLFILLCLIWNLPSRTGAVTKQRNPLIDISSKFTCYQPADSIKWKLIFEDNFSSTGSFDTTKWSYAPRWSPAWAAYLTPDVHYVRQESGNLLLRMDKQVIKNDPVPYHSGGIQTTKKFNFQYGKVEVRAKFNQGKGSWPAIWMMPETPIAYGDWPNSGEIDIMEHVNKEDVVHQTIHNGSVTSADGGSTATQKSLYNSHDFNTYSIIWDETKIEFYINNNLRYTYYKSIPSTDAQWPFDKPFYLILNQSGGAGWPGSIDDADLPFQMEVDYVHVYQMQEKQIK